MREQSDHILLSGCLDVSHCCDQCVRLIPAHYHLVSIILICSQYAYLQCSDPIILVLQDKLNAQAHLQLTTSLLEELELFGPAINPSLHLPSGLWATVAVPGHVIHLGNQCAIFLRERGVKQCDGLDHLKETLLGTNIVG